MQKTLTEKVTPYANIRLNIFHYFVSMIFHNSFLTDSSNSRRSYLLRNDFVEATFKHTC